MRFKSLKWGRSARHYRGLRQARLGHLDHQGSVLLLSLGLIVLVALFLAMFGHLSRPSN